MWYGCAFKSSTVFTLHHIFLFICMDKNFKEKCILTLSLSLKFFFKLKTIVIWFYSVSGGS